jgi:hypothetical protein
MQLVLQYVSDQREPFSQTVVGEPLWWLLLRTVIDAP